MGGIDLHVHTTASDGAFTPSQVVEGALAKELAHLAITDHDTTAGIDEALEAARGTALEVIPGVELSSELDSEEIHILGYYLNHHDEDLHNKLGMICQARYRRARQMVEKLAGFGVSLHWERVEEIAGGGSAFGRPHIAQALLEKGYVASIGEAFERYIGRERPAYVARYKLTPVEAVQMITAAKGLPVLAHPRGQEHVLSGLVEVGLVGLEAYYPSYTIGDSEALLRLAKEYNLIPTGGTDFHGYEGFGTVAVGEVWVPLESVRRLRALAMNRVGLARH